MAKYIIGTGCSWTEGEGAYPDHVWKEYNGRVHRRAPADYLYPFEQEYSWVNVLSKDYLKDYNSINLGIKGIGNRAAVKQLYLTDKVNWAEDEGIIVLMLSGLDRFDFVVRKGPGGGYNNYYYTMWPYKRTPEESDHNAPLWEAYGDLVWSPEMAAMELFCNIKEAEQFVKGKNFKLIIANAFHHEPIPWIIKTFLGESYYNQVDWNLFVHTEDASGNYAFIHELIELDGVMDMRDKNSFYSVYPNFDWPQKYLTNDIHPTIEGYKHIAGRLYNFMQSRNYV
jgi:hypothetical protein